MTPDRDGRKAGRREDLQGAQYWNGLRVALHFAVSTPETIAQALERVCAQQTFLSSRLPAISVRQESANDY